MGGAGNVYGGPLGGPGGERRFRGGPLPRCPLRSLQGPSPAHPQDTYRLAGCLCWGPQARALHPAALEAACGRGAPDPQRPARAGRAARPHGVTSAAASPSRRYLAPPIQAFLRVPIIRARSRSPRPASDLTNRWLCLSQLGLTLADCKSLLSGRTLGA